MHEFLAITISGLVTGGVYAITAGGLTLTYATTGVFNFAHGATGALAAFSYWQLHYGWGWPVWAAVAVVLLILAPAVGILLQLLIMRRLEGTSPTTRLVVTIAVLLSLVATVSWIWDPKTNRTVRQFYAGDVVTIFDIRIPYHDLITLGTAALVAVGLWILLTRTRAGVAMRATVDDRPLAVLNGSRPEIPGMLAWAIGTTLAAISGILIASKISLSPLPLTLLIVNAYAAAVIGRLRSLPMTFVGALILGLANDYSIKYLPKWESAYQYTKSFPAVVPVVVLFIALMLLPQSKLRGHASQRTREIAHRPSWPGSVFFAACVIFGAVVAARSMSMIDLFGSTKMWGIAIIGLSMIPLVGYSGKLSLCQLGFAGIGAICVSHFGGDGNPVALLWAAVICAVVGAVIALPALRLDGIYLALGTAAFAVALDKWIFGLPKFTWFGHEIYLFKGGTLNFKRFDLAGLSVKSDRAYFIFGAVLFALLSLVVVAIRRGEFGRRLLALKDSPAAYATLGMNQRVTTIGVFALSAAMAGIGGGIFGAAVKTTSADQFVFMSGLSILMMMVISGLTSPGAAVLSGVILGTPLMTNLFPDWAQLTTVLIGLNGIALGKNPNGMIPSQLRPHWNPALRYPQVIAAGSGFVVLLYVFREMDLIGNYVMLLGFALALIAVSAVAKGFEARKVTAKEPAEFSAPPERLGLDVPFTPSDIDALDRRLDLQGVGRHG